MTDTQNTTPDQKGLIVRLRELIDSLDSRVPHLEREGEIRIAHEAAALRDKAVLRLAQLEMQDHEESLLPFPR
jgi:hypothetical protein